jgi:ABC-type sugar transport system permease subunit
LRFLLLHIPLQLVVSLFLAWLLHQNIKGISFFRGAFFLPVIVSGVVITILWQQMLAYDDGVINRLLTAIGIPKIGWLVNPGVAIYSIGL